ncbi:Coiled-coil domain-containing protein 38 [Tupaia chinensis]|uniref:Coiled-coil domain-containing protein 38 n=1 Tax=Tupaia chinensis TaxID=246437 RepID=L9KK68_TUPCH|nr:Coiled-coil domain-containing protein 38 [Tupaia chinensis]
MIEKRKEKIMNRSMKIYQKSTFSSRMKSRSHLSQLAFYADPGGATFEHFGLDPTLILRLTEGADANRTVYEFISDQRERFLLEYALSTKRNTIKKYEKHIVMKERQLSKAEKKLQEDAMAFEEFLRENDQRSVDALKIAAQETLNKLQTTAELKKASMEVQAVKRNSNIEFLLEQKEMLKANCMREEEKAAELELRSRLFSFGEFNSDAQKRAFGQSSTWKAIYFAEQFLEALLSTNTGYAVEKEDGSLPVVSKQVTYQLMNLHQQIKRRSCEEKLIDSLSKKINQVYRVCIGDAEVGSLNAVQKLVKVESRLVELSDLIESIPKETVEVIERIKQKERRQRLREEKMKEKQKHQEERLKAALERAVAQPKRKTKATLSKNCGTSVSSILMTNS